MTRLMSLRLKPIHEQVIVITGASSGIGLVTARMAVRRGARVLLTARNREALQRLTDELNANGSDDAAGHVEADVADEATLRRVAEEACERFGCIDTWGNGADVSVYGRVIDVSLNDQRRLFDTNFWGVVIGSRLAVEHLRKDGGALINIGSTLSDRAVPLQGVYSASKHAVKAYTDALRMEVEHDGLSVAVTLIKPYSIDTPYAEHAASRSSRCRCTRRRSSARRYSTQRSIAYATSTRAAAPSFSAPWEASPPASRTKSWRRCSICS
ncbi:MAG TPA: SDR family NAD(P)-dependent oxidoreductase [Nitrospira sp.]|nr:SDR family NAD(P)-dependent oxidoreductase [Nitrospira sp.]